MISTGLVQTEAELQQILDLQRENLAPALAPSEVESQGFVTVQHTLEVLRQMHALAPSVVAREGAQLAGYALTMPVETRALLPILEPMFQQFERITWRGRPLPQWRYYVMGQVCVARGFRGQGVFDALYREHRARYAERFELLVTEIATRNTRSMRAHARVGFETLHTYRDATDNWAVVGLDLRGPQPA